MALTPSTMIELGTKAPPFSLPEPEGATVSFTNVRGRKGTLVMFICNHCPYVQHMKKELADTATQYLEWGVGVVAINSNDVETYPQDGPDKMAEEKKAFGYPFPYLLDETQEVARAYDAACTPDFFLFDSEDRLVYRGQFDDTRPGQGTPTGEDLTAAVRAVVEGQPVPQDQRPSTGCNIKWKAS